MRISDWSSDVCSSDLTAITVYQDPNCGCCTGWVEHMRDAGFDVTAIKTADMASVKQKLGVPPKLGSCHSGVVNATGQIIEGHVPAHEMGNASCRDSVCQYVWIWGVAVP